MRRLAARLASAQTFELAEGPVWDEARQQLVWVDINPGLVYLGTLSAGQVEVTSRLFVDSSVGAAVPAANGDLVVAGTHAVHRVSREGERLASWQILPPEPTIRLNDAGCDPAGRFLVGSLGQPRRPGQEVLARIEHSGEVTTLDDDLTLSNGLAWSPDGRTLYSIDTIPGVVWRRDYDPDTGAVGTRSELLRVSDGGPDGMAVDADGHLWIAIWGVGEVRCLRPDGTLVAVIDVPVPHVTCVAFVGPDRDRLLITTARDELTESQREEFPDSGRLYLAEPGIAGAPVSLWRPPVTPLPDQARS